MRSQLLQNRIKRTLPKLKRTPSYLKSAAAKSTRNFKKARFSPKWQEKKLQNQLIIYYPGCHFSLEFSQRFWVKNLLGYKSYRTTAIIHYFIHSMNATSGLEPLDFFKQKKYKKIFPKNKQGENCNKFSQIDIFERFLQRKIIPK